MVAAGAECTCSVIGAYQQQLDRVQPIQSCPHGYTCDFIRQAYVCSKGWDDDKKEMKERPELSNFFFKCYRANVHVSTLCFPKD
jgi:hypothetical protein